MIERLKRLGKMIETTVQASVCHRALHGYAALAYGAGCLEVDKVAVQAALAAIYAVMFLGGERH